MTAWPKTSVHSDRGRPSTLHRKSSAKPYTTQGTVSDDRHSVYSALRPGKFLRAMTSSAGTPTSSAIAVEDAATIRLLMNESVKLGLSGRLRYHCSW